MRELKIRYIQNGKTVTKTIIKENNSVKDIKIEGRLLSVVVRRVSI